MKNHKLGQGVLTWNAIERRMDRYGTVYLIPEGHNSFTPEPSDSLIDVDMVKRLDGTKGNLVAVVKEARESTHIGDMFRGLYPSTPDVGEAINLGCGHLFFEEIGYAKGICVGLKPDDNRQSDWLDPVKLYRAHEQTVVLYFHPTE